MSAPGAETRSVVVERDTPHPPEKVWRALTEPHLIAEWLMPGDFKPVVGHRFNLRRRPRPELEIVIDCQVLAVEPNRLLRYTWTALDLDSVVTWTLTPTETGTRLRMEQTGFRPDQRQAYGGAGAGWRGFVAALEDLLARLD